MNYSSFDSTANKPYIPLWIKYRPAILQMMVASSEAPQQYKMYAHEFKSLNPKEKGVYSFTLEVTKGKAKNNIKASLVAIDLLHLLQTSRKATELMGADEFKFVLDKQFILHVTRLEKTEEPA
jgi:hypothetical protein